MKALWLALPLFAACGPGQKAVEPRADGAGSVVTLLRVRRAVPGGDAFDLSTGEIISQRLADTLEPCCSAFAVRGLGQLPGVWLVTAGHCLGQDSTFDGAAKFRSLNGWGNSSAGIEYVDSVRDFALLQPETPSELRPYWVGPVPQKGEIVRSVSGVHAGASVGRMGEWLSGPFYETSQTIVLGWSGSPVLDAQGRAFAFVSQCLVADSDCEPKHAIVGILP